jgi:hypothetical protein
MENRYGVRNDHLGVSDGEKLRSGPAFSSRKIFTQKNPLFCKKKLDKIPFLLYNIEAVTNVSF